MIDSFLSPISIMAHTCVKTEYINILKMHVSNLKQKGWNVILPTIFSSHFRKHTSYRWHHYLNNHDIEIHIQKEITKGVWSVGLPIAVTYFSA